MISRFICILFAALTVSCMSLSADLCDNLYSGRFAVQAAMSTGGNLGIGVAHYTESTEFGISGSGQLFNNHNGHVFTPAVFAGLRNSLCEGTYIAYGVNAANSFGKIGGHNIKCNLAVGPYVSLEQMITCHTMLVVWINPYQYQHQKLAHTHSSFTAHSFFSSGGIGVNYLF